MTETDPPTDAASPLERIPWRQVASLAGLVLLIAIVLPFVIYAVPQVVGADHSFVVLSGSMEPTISAGDAIIVTSVAAEEIEQGDVITYVRNGDQTTTHRVVEVVEENGGPAFRTKGDANEDADPGTVVPEQVQGKVMTLGGALFVIPFIGHVIQFTNTPVGFALLFIIPFTLLVVTEIWDIVTASKTDSEDADTGGDGTVEPAATDDTGGTATSDTGGADAADTGPDDADGGAVTFTAAELQLGLAVLGAFLAYSVWVAYATVEAWALGVAGAVGATFLLLAALYVVGGGSPDRSSGGAATADADDSPDEFVTGPDGTERADGDPDRGTDMQRPQPRTDGNGAPGPGASGEGPGAAATAQTTEGESDD